MATIQSVKDKIQGLIDKSNEATGGSDTDLTSAVDNLIANQGGGEIPREKAVNFWDYDGTLLYSYTLAEARVLTSLPALPTYEDTRFYASGWNNTLEKVQAVQGFLDVVTYQKPTDSAYINCFLFVVDGSVETIKMNIFKKSESNAIIDWGDGSTTTINATSSTTYSHTYTTRKKYTVAVFSTSTIYGGDGSSSMITPTNALISVNGGVSVKNYAFANNYGLKFARTGSSSYTFKNCYGLRLIIGETLYVSYIRDNCYSLERACLQYAMGYNFTNNYNMKKLMITTANNPLYSVPPNLKVLFLTATTLVTYNATITVGTLIYVTDDLVDSYKTATGWVDHADYIFPISSYTDE